MKFSTMSYTFSRQKEHFDLEKMLAFTRDYMDGIDWVSLHGQSARDLRRMTGDHGVSVVCHTFFLRGFPTDDPGEFRKAIDEGRRGIEAAVILGAPVVMIPTPGRADVPREQLRKQWIAGLRQLAPMALDAGVALTVENFPGKDSPFVLAADYLEARAEVPGLKLTYDNGNAGSGEPPAESFAACAGDVVHAHFKDWDIVDHPAPGFRPMLDGRHYRPALIGEGRIDQRACLKAMRDAGYQGYINIEYENDQYDPFEATRRATDYLRAMLADI